jgi:hypothetical protein
MRRGSAFAVVVSAPPLERNRPAFLVLLWNQMCRALSHTALSARWWSSSPARQLVVLAPRERRSFG